MAVFFSSKTGQWIYTIESFKTVLFVYLYIMFSWNFCNVYAHQAEKEHIVSYIWCYSEQKEMWDLLYICVQTHCVQTQKQFCFSFLWKTYIDMNNWQLQMLELWCWAKNGSWHIDSITKLIWNSGDVFFPTRNMEVYVRL